MTEREDLLQRVSQLAKNLDDMADVGRSYSAAEGTDKLRQRAADLRVLVGMVRERAVSQESWRTEGRAAAAWHVVYADGSGALAFTGEEADALIAEGAVGAFKIPLLPFPDAGETPPSLDREAVARVIDPGFWRLADDLAARADADPEWKAARISDPTSSSLSKADAIIAMERG